MADIGLNDDGHLADLLRVHSPEHMPFARDADELRDWWNGRAIPLGRDGLRTSLGRLGIGDPRALLAGSRALSLCDHYWISTDPRERWGDVNFFDNGYSEDFGDLLFGKDADAEDAESPDITTDGVLRKRWKRVDGRDCLIKGGNRSFMQEPFNEVIASTIMDALGIDHAGYDLLWIDDNPYSVCEDFIDGSTELVTASRLMSNASGDNLDSYRDGFVSICAGMGIDISGHMARMTLIDLIMMNTDRHLGNYGLIRDADTLEWLGPAPVYDTGTSLMCRSSTERILASILMRTMT